MTFSEHRNSLSAWELCDTTYRTLCVLIPSLQCWCQQKQVQYTTLLHILSLHMYYVKLHRVGLYTELLNAIIPYIVSVRFAVLISTLLHFTVFLSILLCIVSMYSYTYNLPNYAQVPLPPVLGPGNEAILFHFAFRSIFMLKSKK